MDGPHWAGVVPLSSTWGEPITAADLRVDAPVPSAVTALVCTPGPRRVRATTADGYLHRVDGGDGGGGGS